MQRPGSTRPQLDPRVAKITRKQMFLWLLWAPCFVGPYGHLWACLPERFCPLDVLSLCGPCATDFVDFALCAHKGSTGGSTDVLIGGSHKGIIGIFFRIFVGFIPSQF